MKEKYIQRRIIDYLTLRGYFIWRNNTGAVRYKPPRGRARFVRYGLPGSSDIIGVTKDGRFLAIEVKTPETVKNVSPAQKKFIARIRENGGVAFVASSIEDVALQLNEEL